MSGIGEIPAGEHLTVADNYGGRYDGTLKAQFFHRGTRFIVVQMHGGSVDGDADELDDRVENALKKKRPRGGGLAKRDLGKNKSGKVVSKKKSAKEEKSPGIAACSTARKALNIEDFAVIKKGSAFSKKAKALYKN